MTWHIIEGEGGCWYAKEHACAAVIVDALRAGATAAMLLQDGAREILAVATVEDAFRAREAFWPDALLYGERNGLAPEGFDFGNSPRDARYARDKRVVFTTSNGTTRLLQAQGAPAVYLGSNVNGLALAGALREANRDVVLVPAGRVGDGDHRAEEDWVAATAIAILGDETIGEGALYYRDYRQLIELDGMLNLFESAPHAGTLRQLGLAEDIAFCARNNIAAAVPMVVEHNDYGLILRDGSRA